MLRLNRSPPAPSILFLTWTPTNANYPLRIEIVLYSLLHTNSFLILSVILIFLTRLMIAVTRFQRNYVDFKTGHKNINMNFISIQTYNETNSLTEINTLIVYIIFSLVNSLTILLYLLWKNNPDLYSSWEDSGQDYLELESKQKIIVWLTGSMCLVHAMISWYRFIWKDTTLLPFRRLDTKMEVVVKPPVYVNRDEEDENAFYEESTESSEYEDETSQRTVSDDSTESGNSKSDSSETSSGSDNDTQTFSKSVVSDTETYVTSEIN